MSTAFLQRVSLLLIVGFCNQRSAQATSARDSALVKRIGESPTLPLTEQHLFLHADLPGFAMGAVSGVAVGRDGLLYVIQRGPDANPILVFDQHGKLLRSWGKGDFTLPHSLRIDHYGDIWALDAGSSRIIEYSPSGEKLLTIKVEPVPDTGSPFRGVTDIAFAPDGSVFITDGYGNSRVLQYTAEGTKFKEWGSPGAGPGQFRLPHAIQVSTAGVIYVADRENGRIELFDLAGRYLRNFADVGRCYALRLEGGILWATAGPRDQEPGAPGWLLKIDAKSGRILGHFFVPDQRAGHAFDLLESGDVVETAGSGLQLLQTKH